MASPNIEVGKPVNKTATADITTAKHTSLIGFYVNSTNGGTLQLKAGGAGGTALGGVVTPAIGWHRFPCTAQGGLHATIGGLALDVTFFVQDES